MDQFKQSVQFLETNDGDMIRLSLWLVIIELILLDGLESLSTSKSSSKYETFPHTYKMTTSSFYNRCEITLTSFDSSVG